MKYKNQKIKMITKFNLFETIDWSKELKYYKIFEKSVAMILFDSIKNGDPYALTDYIKKYKNINLQDNALYTPLHYAIRFNPTPEIASILINNGADINAKAHDNRTPLHEASINYRPRTIKLLISHNVRLDEIDLEGNTPLILAAKKEHISSMKLLIIAGAKWEISNNKHEFFIDFLSEKIKNIIIEKYQEQYKKYLIKIKSNDFNI